MSLKKFRTVNRQYVRIALHSLGYFKWNTVLELLSGIVYLVANIIFWYCVTDAGFFIPGWSFSEIMVFIAFSELFFSLESALFMSASKFWRVIYAGALDTMLTRPLDPRARFLMLNVNYKEIITAVVKFIVLLCFSSRRLSIPLLLAGILVVLLANSLLALIRLCLSYSAFWFGKMDAMAEASDCMTLFNKYPLVIMPKAVRLLFMLALPFYFFSTFPTELVIGKLNGLSIWFGCLGMIANLILWLALNKILWERGRRRYEGING